MSSDESAAGLRDLSLPSGPIHAIYLHWSAGDYETPYPAYHFCIAGADAPRVVVTHDLRENMRDVRSGGSYAAHTRGRNSYAAGIGVAAMRDARPDDFGAFPITGAQIEAMCALSARLVQTYGVAIEAIKTHAEAALEDGYFGAESDDVRWDIARIVASPEPLRPEEATVMGNRFRARIAELIAR